MCIQFTRFRGLRNFVILGVLWFSTGCASDEKTVRDALEKFQTTIHDPGLQGVAERLRGVNRDIQNKGVLFDTLSGGRVLTGYDYGQVYDWDLYFECVYQLYNGESRYCFANLDAFLARQQPDGFIQRSFGPYPYGLTHMFKPFIAQTALLGMRQENDTEWLARHYNQIVRYENCWYEKYDSDNNQLCVWHNADHSGMDNQTSRVIGDYIDEGVDLNCYLYREWLALAELADMLSFDQDKEWFEQKADSVKGAINTYLWDEENGFYYDRLENTGELNRVKGISGFLPLYAGIASPSQAERLVKEHLVNPEEFWAEYPLHTLARDEAAYDSSGAQPPSGRCNWNGTTWIPVNYMVFHGLMDYGYDEAARKLCEKTFDLVYRKNPLTREYYNSETGEGYGRNPFYGWSVLAYFMPLEYALDYNPTDPTETRIIPLATRIIDFTNNH